MRDLYLHIGLHKTGTSYLQKLFLENRELLSESGLGLAPYMHPQSGTHHPIIAEIERQGAEAVFDAVAQTRGERVLVSAEELCVVMEDKAAARAIRDAAARHFNPKLVIFLRRQDHLKESVYAQIVKNWFVGGILEDEHYGYDHDARLRALEEVFGRENIVVRIYEAHRKDLAGAFFEAIDTPLDRSRVKDVTPQNVSMNRRKLLFMSQVPKPQEFSGPRLTFPTRFLTRVVTASPAIADDGLRSMMSPAERRDLVARHLPGNEAVVARYTIGAPGPFLDLPDPGETWAPPEPIRAAERRALYREALGTAWRRHNPFAAARLTLHLTRMFAGAARNARPAQTNHVSRKADAAADFR